jgi:hypothetical protein
MKLHGSDLLRGPYRYHYYITTITPHASYVSGKERRSQETAYGPVKGYVATRSATGTKTDTPLIEMAQSISALTRDQMEAQAAQTVPQVLRDTSGVIPEQNGADTRFEDAVNPRVDSVFEVTAPLQMVDAVEGALLVCAAFKPETDEQRRSGIEWHGTTRLGDRWDLLASSHRRAE